MTPEHKAAIAEGRKRASERRLAEAAVKSRTLVDEAVSIERAAVQESSQTTVEVIYRPYDGDPHTTKLNGITFRANVPVKLDRGNPAHYSEQLLPKTITGPDGQVLTKHSPAKVFMGDHLKSSPCFEVDGERAKKLVNKRILPPAGHGWAEDHEDDISESTAIDANVAL